MVNQKFCYFVLAGVFSSFCSRPKNRTLGQRTHLSLTRFLVGHTSCVESSAMGELRPFGTFRHAKQQDPEVLKCYECRCSLWVRPFSPFGRSGHWTPHARGILSSWHVAVGSQAARRQRAPSHKLKTDLSNHAVAVGVLGGISLKVKKKKHVWPGQVAGRKRRIRQDSLQWNSWPRRQ